MYQNRRQEHQTTATQSTSTTQQPYTVQHDFDGSSTVTATIVHALADVSGADVTDAEFVLNDYVDPDALDKLFANRADGEPRSNGHVTFNVRGYQTTVYSTGQISIVPPQSNHQQTR